MKKIQGHDTLQRINYLYQISKRVCEKNQMLSAYYGNLIINLGKKNVLKLHPDLKRQICKKCRIVMVNNITSHTRITKKHGNPKCIEWTCRCCGNKRTLPVPKDKDGSVWVERKEAIVEVINT